MAPTATRSFAALKSKLKAALEDFWEDETTSVTAPAVGSLSELWKDGPELDSKAVQRASPIVEKLLGIKLTAKMLKRGGYKSRDEFVSDMLGKLEAAFKQTTGSVVATV